MIGSCLGLQYDHIAKQDGTVTKESGTAVFDTTLTHVYKVNRTVFLSICGTLVSSAVANTEYTVASLSNDFKPYTKIGFPVVLTDGSNSNAECGLAQVKADGKVYIMTPASLPGSSTNHYYYLHTAFASYN